jgi:very-short-patch-repair endonuclease
MHGQSQARGQRIDAAIAAFAAGQHGVVTRGQLGALGLKRGAIEHRLTIGRLYLIHRGVYAVGHPELTQEGRWMAGVFGAGKGAVLSHRSAATLWRLLLPSPTTVEVTVPTARSPRGVVAYESRLPADEITDHKGIPVTTVARTVLDLAGVATRPVVARTLREAQTKPRVGELQARPQLTLDALAALLDRHPGRRGNRTIRAMLAEAGFGTGITRSELEARFTRFLRRYSLPAPRRNVHMQVGGLDIEADCVWPEVRVIVELDGRQFHDNATAFEQDRARDRALATHGWTVVRVTWRQLQREAPQLARDLRTLLQRTAA